MAVTPSGVYPDNVDVSTFRGSTPDLDPNFTPISGPRAVAEHVARRLCTSPGTMHDEEYGFDLRAAFNAGLTQLDLRRIQAGVTAEAGKVEGVDTADVSVKQSADGALTVRVDLTLDDGTDYPLVFSLNVDGLTLLPLLGG